LHRLTAVALRQERSKTKQPPKSKHEGRSIKPQLLQTLHQLQTSS
jgi:hypothetical protein